MNYWGYRTDNRNRSFFFNEILEGRLRQGWGYDEGQRLDLEDVDISAKGNLPIYRKVKKGDYLIVPHLEGWDEMVIVQATEDFDKGYKFEISEFKDYGHIFPVKFIKKFSKYNFIVDGGIRATFKCKSRFWNINRYENEIVKILQSNEVELTSSVDYEERFRKSIDEVFDENKFAEDIYRKLNESNQASEWEYILCEGLKKILPESYSVQTTSNKTEYKHGADLLIYIPGLLDATYVIAIQVKDYTDQVSEDIVEQICKADEYFNKEENVTLIDKYLVITKASLDVNADLKKKADQKNVKILFDKDVKVLLSKMSKAFLNEKLFE